MQPSGRHRGRCLQHGQHRPSSAGGPMPMASLTSPRRATNPFRSAPVAILSTFRSCFTVSRYGCSVFPSSVAGVASSLGSFSAVAIASFASALPTPSAGIGLSMRLAYASSACGSRRRSAGSGVAVVGHAGIAPLRGTRAAPPGTAVRRSPRRSRCSPSAHPCRALFRLVCVAFRGSRSIGARSVRHRAREPRPLPRSDVRG